MLTHFCWISAGPSSKGTIPISVEVESWRGRAIGGPAHVPDHETEATHPMYRCSIVSATAGLILAICAFLWILFVACRALD